MDQKLLLEILIGKTKHRRNLQPWVTIKTSNQMKNTNSQKARLEMNLSDLRYSKYKAMSEELKTACGKHVKGFSKEPFAKYPF